MEDILQGILRCQCAITKNAPMRQQIHTNAQHPSTHLLLTLSSALTRF